MSQYNKLENGSFIDYERAKTFQFDHITNKPSEWDDYEVDPEVASTMYNCKQFDLIVVPPSANR